MTLVLTIEQARATGPSIVGGKAFALAELSGTGFEVPPFIVVLPEAFEGNGLCTEATASLEAALSALPATHFAVRSSGRAEDGVADSHAGQFLTVLNVKPGDVAVAATRVFASGRAASVMAYRVARGRQDADPPAVIVQIMVPARAAGVAFAADPVSGRRDRVVISAAAGLGDRLVSGEVNGETWILAQPRLEATERPSNGSVLSEAEARDVARLCLAASAVRDAPQDIEWAFAPDDAKPILLQARPITSQLLPSAPPETRLLVLDNSNIVESYPGVVSPLTFTFAAQAYRRVYRTFLAMIGVSKDVVDAHAAELANMLSGIDGRIYYNLGNWYRLLSLLPFFSSNRHHMEMMMGVSHSLPDEVMAGVLPTKSIFKTFKMAGYLAFAALRLPSTYKAFMARVARTVPPRTDWNAALQRPLSELAAEYRRVEAALLDRWDAPIINDFLCMMAFGGSRSLLERWAGPDGVALHNDVMIGQGDIISAEPARLIREMGEVVRRTPGAREVLASEDQAAIFDLPELGQLLSTYIQRFGDRRIGELKLEAPTLDEEPTSLFRAVLASASRAGLQRQCSDPQTSLALLFRNDPLRRQLISRALAYAKARVRDRENLRFERTRIFGFARRLFLAMGRALTATGLIERDDDVFHLTVEELLGLAEGMIVTADVKGLIAVRRAERAAYMQMPDPPERILLRGSIADIANRLRPSREAMTKDDSRERRGTACGGGTVVGPARVVRDPASEHVLPGEILVARHTDPGWISHFASAAAVIAERGSVLSHSAIVSRELGIPCVVAVENACTWIATGDRVLVDGSSGWVRKCHD